MEDYLKRKIPWAETESGTFPSTIDLDALNELLSYSYNPEKEKVELPNDLEVSRMSDSDDGEDDEAEEDGAEENIEGIELSGEKSEVKKAKRILKGKLYSKTTENGRHECRKCDKKYVSNKGLVNHYEGVHLQKRYKCDICNEAVYKYRDGLREHKRKCQGKVEKKFKCDLCGEAFSLKVRLSTHLSQVHKIIPEKMFPCDICGKIFRRSGNLREHKEVVYFGKRFCCRFCGKPYLGRGSVFNHEKKCAKKKPVK